jgi:murein tripeptide amidase MpaA
MKFILALLPLLLVAVSGLEIGVRNYNGYQVLTVAAETREQYELLKSLLMSDKYDFWTNPKLGGYTDIMTTEELLPELKATFEAANMEYNVKIPNVGKAVEEERIENEKALRAADSRMVWNAYNRWSVIEPWIQGLASYDVATVSTIGRSSEGRNIYMVKVSTGTLPNGRNKKVIFIDSNIHAREFIAGATGTWMLNELVTNSANHASVLAEIDFYFVPMVNPDGYEFGHTSDRMWRKTRSVNSGSTCRGCDPNRNFAFFWGGESTSSNPCSDLYKGPSAFSEPETAAIRDAIRAIQAEAVIWSYITIHSYAQMWLLSWGYTQGVYPPDYPELLSWGQQSIAALQAVHGTRYTTGQGADLLYGVGGASDDYAKSEGIKYTTTAELRDTGAWGFLLPAAQIIPTAQETWQAVLKTAEIVISHG